jgi:hypothetical protein
VLMGL